MANKAQRKDQVGGVGEGQRALVQARRPYRRMVFECFGQREIDEAIDRFVQHANGLLQGLKRTLLTQEMNHFETHAAVVVGDRLFADRGKPCFVVGWCVVEAPRFQNANDGSERAWLIGIHDPLNQRRVNGVMRQQHPSRFEQVVRVFGILLVEAVYPCFRALDDIGLIVVIENALGLLAGPLFGGLECVK